MTASQYRCLHAQKGARSRMRLRRRNAQMRSPLVISEQPKRGNGHPPRISSRYLMSVSSRNIGRYIEMMITPTIRPTPIIMIGSMIEVSVAIDASTSSS
jgi:hypothetical protein